MKQLFYVGRAAWYLHQWARLVRFNIGTFIRLLQRILSRSTRTNPEEVSSSRSLSWNSLRLQVHSHGFSAKLLQFEKKPKYQYEFKSNYFIKNKFHFLCVLICSRWQVNLWVFKPEHAVVLCSKEQGCILCLCWTNTLLCGAFSWF